MGNKNQPSAMSRHHGIYSSCVASDNVPRRGSYTLVLYMFHAFVIPCRRPKKRFTRFIVYAFYPMNTAIVHECALPLSRDKLNRNICIEVSRLFPVEETMHIGKTKAIRHEGPKKSYHALNTSKYWLDNCPLSIFHLQPLEFASMSHPKNDPHSVSSTCFSPPSIHHPALNDDNANLPSPYQP
jgi:hypothetical protein